MNAAPYAAAGVPIRDDITAAHSRVWRHLAGPGNWWHGHERIAIAAESRHALACDLCKRRTDALSPNAVSGRHQSLGTLPDNVVEVVHRIRTDPARLSKAWYQSMLDTGLSEGQYVETVAVIAQVVAMDTFARGVGSAPIALPAPIAGEPSRYRPKSATVDEAWVPWLSPAGLVEEGVFPPGRPPANIQRAMSLVPNEVKSFFGIVGVQYLPGPAMRDFGREYRAINHAQIELLAGRVSVLNQCVY